MSRAEQIGITQTSGWAGKLAETGRHSLGDSSLHPGFRGHARRGEPQADRRVCNEECGCLTFPRAPPRPTPGLRMRRPPPVAAGCTRDPGGSLPRDPTPARPQEKAGRPAGAGSAGCGRAQRDRPGPGGVAALSPIPPLRRPGSRRAHRLHGGSHVVVALRLLGQPRPLQQLLPVPHVARPRLAPRTARPPVRSPVAAEAAHAHWLAGRPEAASCRLQAAPPLAPSRWLAPRAVAGAANAAEGGEAAAQGDGRVAGRLRSGSSRVGRRGVAGVVGEGRAGPNGLFQGDVTYYK